MRDAGCEVLASVAILAVALVLISLGWARGLFEHGLEQPAFGLAFVLVQAVVIDQCAGALTTLLRRTERAPA